MDRTRWLMTIALGLAPMLGSMALERPGGGVYLSPSAAAASSASSPGNSGGNNSSSNSSGNNSGTSSSSSSSSSSSVSVGISPKAKVTNPHGPLATPCANCHTASAWKPVRSNPDFNHDLTGYPLRGMHQNVACAQCHTSLVFKNVSSQCADCHADIHKRQFGANCSQCHSVKGWQTSLQAIKNHSNRFPLVGAHALVNCDQCHKQAAVSQFTGASTSCYSCHQQDFKTPVVDHVGLGFPTTCESCHTLDTWFNAKFDHLKYTGYALTGAHATLACDQCHINNVFKGTPAQCYGCHATDFNNSNNPPHAQAGFPKNCAICHTTTDWNVTTFDHATYAHYALTGKHATVTCAQCHVNNSYVNTPTACYSCHQADFQGTNNPPHVAAGFPTDCSLCHTTAGWTASTFNHNSTGFALTGAHTTTACALCHTNGNYSLNSSDTACYKCHADKYQSTTDPPHAGAMAKLFPTASCQTCHNTTAWTGATFNHDTTGFTLTGAHQTLACSACHVSNNYLLGTAQTTCVNCHLKDFNGTTNPNHVTSNFPQTCQTCHNTTSWTQASFNHNNTGFPLTGAHATVACALCHVNNNYSLTAANTTCVSCHLKDFNGTTNPNHVTSNFPQTCQTCHNTTSWTNASFDHSTTGFPLTGAHTTVACNLCHVNNNYNLTAANTTCVSCHLKDFNGTTNPNHVTSNFPQTCQTCHNTTSWTNATFDHSTTGFPLTGAHTTVACNLCHVNNNYNLTAANTTCVSCHLTDYNGTTNPNHMAANYPQTCQTCHNTTSWLNATFDHSTTGFPLTGAHTTVACNLCHVNNNYNLTAANTTCVSCHLADYNGTTNPNHVTSGFPQTCASCHTTTAWTGATFNHASTGFALTGAHTSLQCAQCHVNNNYSLTAAQALCSNCHMTDYNGTTNPAHAAAGFPTTCDTCHTTTAWTGATFNHNNTPFPLTGAHTTVACTACHKNNVFAGTPTDCYSCHQTDYTGTTNPNHTTAGFPTTCATCHTTTAWTGATFNHTWFNTNHGNANGVCATCHTNSSDYSIFTCTGCHGGNNAANFHHPNVNGYVYNSVNCYACHKNGGGG